jgi:hypothetical protein
MPSRSLPAAEARELANRRHAHERGAVARHVDSVVKRAGVLTDDERCRIAVALVTSSRAAQGLPATVEDPAALATVAAVISKAGTT